MALRREDLVGPQEAVVLQFPVAAARTRARAQRQLERRRRTVLVLVVLTALAALWHMPSDAAADRAVARAPRVVEVEAGQTLWDLAEAYAPPRTDMRVYVSEVEALNDLAGPIRPGQRLRLPR